MILLIRFDCADGKLNLINIYKIIKYKIDFLRENPDYFDPDGLVCFCGPQGSGKTLSAVNYVYNLLAKYPQCILVTNIQLTDYPIVTFEDWLKSESGLRAIHLYDVLDDDLKISVLDSLYREENRVFQFKNNDDFQRYENDYRGVIFLVDEIQLYLNSLQSKNINMDVMTQVSQQRKQRKHIVATSQIFGRMAKPLREQFSCIILCKKYFNFLQINRLIDRDSLDDDNSTGTNLKGTVKKKFFWIHSPDMYGRFDTYYVIKNNEFVGGENQVDIYNYIDSLKGDF